MLPLIWILFHVNSQSVSSVISPDEITSFFIALRTPPPSWPGSNSRSLRYMSYSNGSMSVFPLHVWCVVYTCRLALKILVVLIHFSNFCSWHLKVWFYLMILSYYFCEYWSLVHSLLYWCYCCLRVIIISKLQIRIKF